MAITYLSDLATPHERDFLEREGLDANYRATPIMASKKFPGYTLILLGLTWRYDFHIVVKLSAPADPVIYDMRLPLPADKEEEIRDFVEEASIDMFTKEIE